MFARNKLTCITKIAALTGTLVVILISINASAQWTGLRVNGEQIEDASGKNVVLKGFGTPQIATALDIAESTAHDHVKRMMLKTRARNRVELAAKALGWRGA